MNTFHNHSYLSCLASLFLIVLVALFLALVYRHLIAKGEVGVAFTCLVSNSSKFNEASIRIQYFLLCIEIYYGNKLYSICKEYFLTF